MEFGFTQEQKAFRSEVHEFINRELPPEMKWRNYYFDFYSHYEEAGNFTRTMSRKLGARGWLSLTWPKKYGGQDASPFFQLILQEELEYNHCPGIDIFGTTMIAPTLIRCASEEQKREHLPGIAKGKVFWCECLSEPDAGSDLASVRTIAKEDGDHFVINGQKVWTSGAHQADWTVLLARTSQEPPKHRALSFFLVDMKTPGITINPVINMAGDHEFNEVFFEDVRVPKKNMVGDKNRGWYVSMTLLNFERWSIPFYAIARRYLDDLIEYARQMGSLNPALRHRLSELLVECEVGQLLHYRAAWMQERGDVPDYEAVMVKLYTLELNQRVAAASMEVLGPYSVLTKGSKWAPLDGQAAWNYLRSVGNSLEMGSSEIDRNIIAIRGLGLPSR